MNKHVDIKRRDRGPKGRSLDDAAFEEMRGLFEGQQLRRDLLIEYLHKIQDTYGCISAAHIRAMAELMRLPQAEIYEVASFYDHFDVVREGEDAPAPLTIRVCDSLSCMMAGSEALIAALESGVDPTLCANRARALHGSLRYRAGGSCRRQGSRSRDVGKPDEARQ